MLIIFPARIKDAQILFDWRNDPITRAMSRNSDLVEWNDHVVWLTSHLALPQSKIYIAENFRKPVGTFRIDGDEISYTVAPDERGKGYGVIMLCRAREMFGVLRAEIYERNTASIKIAERAGMCVRILK